jgi:CDP-diacylglycerol--serine O-phosphatidyltransferase
MAAFSAYRLGKFNIDDRQTGGFLGLPTPANALFWVGLALADSGGFLEAPFLIEFWENSKNSTGLVGFISLLLGLLLIAEVPLLALKFKGFGFAENAAKYILIASGIVLFLLFGFASVPIILLLYFIISLIAKNDIQS